MKKCIGSNTGMSNTSLKFSLITYSYYDQVSVIMAAKKKDTSKTIWVT